MTEEASKTFAPPPLNHQSEAMWSTFRKNKPDNEHADTPVDAPLNAPLQMTISDKNLTAGERMKAQAATLWSQFAKTNPFSKTPAPAFEPDTITTFAELVQLDLNKPHKALENIEPVTPPALFRPFCGNCKVFDHCEQQCPKTYPDFGFDDYTQPLAISNADLGLEDEAADRPYEFSSRRGLLPTSFFYCFFCNSKRHIDEDCHRRKIWERTIQERNKTNPSRETVAAEKRFNVPYNLQYRYPEQWPEELRGRPCYQGWESVFGHSFCWHCLQADHALENCEKLTVDCQSMNARFRKAQDSWTQNHNVPQKTPACYSCGDKEHTVLACWRIFPELRYNHTSSHLGFNNRRIKFFDLKNWNHHMVSNPLKGQFIHFWLTNRGREEHAHPGGEYEYIHAGASRVDNAIVQRRDAQHAFQIAKADKPTEAANAALPEYAKAIRDAFTSTWGIPSKTTKSTDSAASESKGNAANELPAPAKQSRKARKLAALKAFNPNFCDFCHRVGHREDECWKQFPVLKPDGSWTRPNLDPVQRVIGVRCQKCDRVHREGRAKCHFLKKAKREEEREERDGDGDGELGLGVKEEGRDASTARARCFDDSQCRSDWYGFRLSDISE